MIYIQEKIFSKQIDMFYFLMGLDEFDIIVWLYPESKLKHLFGFNLSHCEKNQGKPVTKYDNSIVIKKTIRQKLTIEFITQIYQSKRIFTKNVDSCVFYKKGEYDWYASLIGHEGMFLIKDNDKKNELFLKRYKPTLKKPNFW